MSATALLTQLTTLSDSLKTANALIARLSKLQFSPGSEPLDSHSGSLARLELAQEIHETLKDLEESLEFLAQEAADFTADSSLRRTRNAAQEESRITAKVTKLEEDLRHSRQAFRNAQIAAKFAAEEAKRAEREALYEGYRKEAEGLETEQLFAGDSRELLFAGRSNKAASRRGLNKDEVLVHASTDVTSALRRTHDLLSTELSRSRFAQETFDESTAALAQLGEDYNNLDTLLSSSKNLLGTLLRSQKSDTWYLETAFYILLTTLCWLFFRRILFGPFVKLPLFFWKVGLFLVNWVLWKPLFTLLSLTGIVTSGPATTTGLARTIASSSTTRAPLIVQPSATGRGVPFPSDMADTPRGVPAGAGGAGAKQAHDKELEGKMSEEIGKMAEASGKEGSQEDAEKELPRRGDGTVLQERGAIPKNPKKKTFEAEEEQQGRRVKRDEL
jgi:protein transport protein SEC20